MPNHFEQTYGIEIECYLPDGSNQASAAMALNQRLAAIDPSHACRIEGYNHAARHYWKIVPDGSLGDYARGIELVSPILRGEQGLALIQKACEALSDFGCTVNKKCGFHVHVGGFGEALPVLKNLVKLYSAFESVIDSIMPVSRRGSTCGYAKSMTAANIRALDSATSMTALRSAAGVGSDRHHKVNLLAMDRHHTVEFRQHSGTLEGNKAVRWTALCLKMVAAAKAGNLPLSTPPRASSQNRARIGSKSHQVGEMLLRPEGVTGPEICAMLGWPSVSIPQQAAICGLEFTTQRMGRTVRYFAVRSGEAAPTTPAIAINLDGFASIIGADDTELAYLRQRTLDLGGAVAWAA